VGSKIKHPKNRFLFNFFDCSLIIGGIFLIFAFSYLSFWLRNRQPVVNKNKLNLPEPTPKLIIEKVKESTMSAIEEDKPKYDNTTLQGFTVKDCAQLPVCVDGGDDCDTNGSTITLTDARDGKKYKVRRFQEYIFPDEVGEGECWMIENLDYEYKDSIDADDSYGRFYSNKGLENICPDNWKMTDYSLVNMIESVNRINSIDFILSPKYFNAKLSGMVDSENKLRGQGEVGYLWEIKTAYVFSKEGILNYNSSYPERMGNFPFFSSLSSVCSDSLAIDNKYPIRCYQNFKYE